MEKESGHSVNSLKELKKISKTTDFWGTEINLDVINRTIQSAGPDRVFDTEDDLLLKY